MSSIICQNFVQNAWRKDLCSNCFKSKEEHDSDGESPEGVTNRYLSTVTTVYQTHNYYGHHSWKSLMAQDKGLLKAPSLLRSLTNLNSINNNNNSDSEPNQNHCDEVRSDPGTETVNGLGSVSDARLLSAILTDQSDSNTSVTTVGILRTTTSDVKRPRAAISFTDVEPQVIGFGGDVIYSSDEDPADDSDSGDSVNSEDLTEEEVGLKRLTEKNTSYNSMASNLLGPIKLSSVQEVPHLPSQVTSVNLTKDPDRLPDPSALKEAPKVPIKPFSLNFNYSGVKVHPVAPFMKDHEPLHISENPVKSKSLNDLPIYDKLTPTIEQTDDKLGDGGESPLPPLIPASQDKPDFQDDIILGIEDMAYGSDCPSTSNSSEVSEKPPDLPSTPPPLVSSSIDNGHLLSTFCSPKSFLYNGTPNDAPPLGSLHTEESPIVSPPTVITTPLKGSGGGSSTPNVYGVPSSPKFATINASKSGNKPPVIKPKPKVPIRPSNWGSKDNLVSSSESVISSTVPEKESIQSMAAKLEKELSKNENESHKLSQPGHLGQDYNRQHIEVNKEQVPPPPSATSEYLIIHPKTQNYKIQRSEKAMSSYGDYQVVNRTDRVILSGPEIHRSLLHTVSYEPEKSDMASSQVRSQSLTRLCNDVPQEVDLGSKGSYNPVSTPPEYRRKVPNERGRERSKKRTSKLKSLKKFLKLGGKDSDDKAEKLEQEIKKPKPEIIHPLDLNTSGVQVIRNKNSPVSPSSPVSESSLESPVSPYAAVDLNGIHHGQLQDYAKPVAQEIPKMSLGTNSAGKMRPPPPPRGKSLEDSKKLETSPPVRPPPPKSDLLKKCSEQCSSPSSSTQNSPVRNDYANLGDIRSSIVPKKPERSSSLRDVLRDDHTKRRAPQPPLSITGVNISDSETGEPSPSSLPRWKTSRLSMRHGRTVFHKNLEENYGAVISANHEALAQILEQVLHQRSHSQVDVLKFVSDLRWDDFKVVDNTRLPCLGWWKFVEAIHHDILVTVMITLDSLDPGPNHKTSFSCIPIVSFKDVVPSEFMPPIRYSGQNDMNQVTANIFPEMMIQTLPELCDSLDPISSQEFPRQACFILLQLLHALKSLQAQGVEEVNDNLDNFVLSEEENCTQLRLVLLEQQMVTSDLPNMTTSTGKISLCQCALVVLFSLLRTPNPLQKVRLGHELNLPEDTPFYGAYCTIADLLQQEKAVSLTRVKSLLEFILWGPDDPTLDVKEHETALQRWLDLERATVLNNIVKTQGLWNIQLTVLEEYHLLFLVRATARSLKDSSSFLLPNNTNF